MIDRAASLPSGNALVKGGTSGTSGRGQVIRPADKNNDYLVLAIPLTPSCHALDGLRIRAGEACTFSFLFLR